MKIDNYFGSYKVNNYNQLKQYISSFDKELSSYYNFGNSFFKGNYNLNYGNFLKDEWLNENPLLPKEVFKYMVPYNEISFCYTSSRSYVVLGTNIKIGALKAYPMSVFLDKEETDRIVKEINKTILDYKKLDNEEIVYNTISNDMVYRKK